MTDRLVPGAPVAGHRRGSGAAARRKRHTAAASRLAVATIAAFAWLGTSAPVAAEGTLPAQQAPPPGGTVIPDPDVFEASAPTDDPVLEAQVRKLARQLRCPTCQALSIADSPSELAREMEGVIRLRLQEGMSPEEVRKSFVDSYGEWVLLSPEPVGFNLLIYILPLVAVLAGMAVVVMGMRRWLANPGPEEAPPAP